MRRVVHVLTFLALTTLLGLFIGGCTAVTPASSTPAFAPDAKVLRFNNQIEPVTVDPQQVSQVPEITFGALAYEALFKLNEVGEVVPAAAERLEVSQDGLTYTVHLRKGLVYSDGTPLTAHNFEYAFRRALDPTLPGRVFAPLAYVIRGAEDLSEFQALTDTVALERLQDNLGVEAVDDETIVFALEATAAYFPYILTVPLGWPTRQDLVEQGGSNWTTDEQGTYYIGNGPFVLRRWDHGQGTIWEANANYRDGRPKLDGLEMRQIKDFNLTFEAYKNGELDLVSLSSDNLLPVQRDPELKDEYAQITGSTGYLAFNVTRAPFDNVKVRQAIASALDRNDYVAVVLGGAGLPAYSLIPPGSPGHEPDVRQLDFDPERAQQLLAEAGYPNGEGLPLIVLTYAAGHNADTTMEWLQNQLQVYLGVVVQLDPIERQAYGALFRDPATVPQVWFDGWSQNYPDPQNWLSVLFRSDATVVPTGWNNERFDQLTTEADAEMDPARRLDLYRQAHEILVEESPVVFMNWYINGFLIKPYVVGMREHISSNDFTIPGFTSLVNIDLQRESSR